VYSVVFYGWYAGFHYNKSLLQRAGYSAPPKTWKDFEDAAIKISKLDPGRIYGYAMPLVWSPDFTSWMTEDFAISSIGHPYYNATVDKYQFADFSPYFEMLGRIRDAEAMFPGMESLSDDQQQAQFAAGNIGFLGGAGWNVGVLFDQFPFSGGDPGKPNDPNGWDYAPMPVMDPNNVYATPVSASVSVFVSAQVRNDKDKLNKVGDVLRLACGDEIQILMMSNGKNIPVRADINANELYECATLVGASGPKQFFHITIPMLGPVMQIILMLSVLGAMRIADVVIVMTNGQPGGTTNVAMTHILKLFFNFDPGGSRRQYGYGSALAIIMGVILAIMTIIYLKNSKRMKNAY